VNVQVQKSSLRREGQNEGQPIYVADNWLKRVPRCPDLIERRHQALRDGAVCGGSP
jgi:hypothetical protein